MTLLYFVDKQKRHFFILRIFRTSVLKLVCAYFSLNVQKLNLKPTLCSTVLCHAVLSFWNYRRMHWNGNQIDCKTYAILCTWDFTRHFLKLLNCLWYLKKECLLNSLMRNSPRAYRTSLKKSFKRSQMNCISGNRISGNCVSRNCIRGKTR